MLETGQPLHAFRAPDRTLTDVETAASRNEAVRAAAAAVGAVQR